MKISLGINLILSTLVNCTSKLDPNDIIAPINQQKFRVMIFSHNPFVFYQEPDKPSTPSGLDISILDNFADRHGYQMEYVQPNDSITFNVFNSDKLFDDFLTLIKNA